MSFLKRLFGGGEAKPANAAAPAATAEHEGYTIVATPMPEGGQFRLHGTISKPTADGADRTHTLIRADLFASRDACAEATLAKARQVIAEQGDAMFG